MVTGTKVENVSMRPFLGEVFLIAICVLLYEHVEMVTGQPRIEVSFFSVLIFCQLHGYTFLVLVQLLGEWRMFDKYLTH